MKDQKLAAILSLLFPGLGQLYNGETEKGILFLISGAILCLIGFALFFAFIGTGILWLWSAADAYHEAGILNEKEKL